MVRAGRKLFDYAIVAVLCLAGAGVQGDLWAQAATPSRVIGTVASVSGNTVFVKTDSGTTVSVSVPDSAKILRTAPGQKTLAGAAKIGVGDIGPGDRVLMAVTGDPPSANIVIVNKKSDLEAKQQQEQEEWQREGVGGIVKSLDTQAGTVTITSGTHTITIHITPGTVIRRYAPDSVKFSDAQTSTLAAIHPGDQLTARGQKNPGGSEVTADEIVSGSFRNIAGLVTSVNPGAGTFTVKDWVTKKPVTIRTTADSDMRKLDPQMAQMIAMRLKAGAAGAQAGGNGHGGNEAGGGQALRQGGGGGGQWQGRQGAGGTGGAAGGGGLARVLERSPEIHVADLHKGDAVMIVATSGSPDEATAIRMVAGVEPMLEASASGSQSMFSSAWNLGGGTSEAGDEGNP